MEQRTTIAITNKLWKALNDMRKDSSEKYEEVIWRLIRENLK